MYCGRGYGDDVCEMKTKVKLAESGVGVLARAYTLTRQARPSMKSTQPHVP